MKYYYLILFILGIVSCRNTSSKPTSIISDAEKNDSMYFINTDLIENKIGLTSNYFRSVKTIILESKSNNLISEISSLQIIGDSIFILDKVKSKGLFMFNKSGRFIKQVSQLGNGPNEYLEPSDFTIDRKNKVIYILDSKKQEIIIFDLKTSCFKKSLKLNNYNVKCYHLQYLNDKLITDSYYYTKTDSSYLLQEINIENGKCMRKWLSSNQYNKGISERVFTNQSVFFDRNKTPKFVQQFMDTVILLEKNKVTHYFALTGINKLTSKDLALMPGGIIQKSNILLSIDKIYSISNLISFSNYICFNYKRKNFIQTCLYDIKTNKFEIFDGMMDDLIYNNANGILPNFCFSDDNECVYSFIDQTDMERFCNLSKNNMLNNRLDKREKLINISPDSNPILFVYQ